VISIKPIRPRSPGGFQDHLPELMIARQAIIDKIKKVYENFGFVPLETPGIEYSQILTGGDPNFAMQIFRIKGEPENGENELALRFDLTVPLARVVAAYPDLPRPFKRYQIGYVWRAEKPQAGRFREFMQCDFDIVGTNSMIADAEILAVIYCAFQTLGINNFLIKINNRKILDALAPYIGYYPSVSMQIFRIIDKMEKIGQKGVKKELGHLRTKIAQKRALSPEQIEQILNFINISGTNEEIIFHLKKTLRGIPVGEEGIKELEEQ